MIKRQVFYSFHFKNDSWRAGQVRNIGVVEGNMPVSSNDWEEVKRKGDDSIKRWIDTHMDYRSCVIVLIGSDTAHQESGVGMKLNMHGKRAKELLVFMCII